MVNTLTSATQNAVSALIAAITADWGSKPLGVNVNINIPPEATAGFVTIAVAQPPAAGTNPPVAANTNFNWQIEVQ
jgi:hypothetical protein